MLLLLVHLASTRNPRNGNVMYSLYIGAPLLLQPTESQKRLIPFITLSHLVNVHEDEDEGAGRVLPPPELNVMCVMEETG
jgi:hypothetical protein